MKLNHSRSQSNSVESLDENEIEQFKMNDAFPGLTPSVHKGLVKFLKNKNPNKYKYINNDETAVGNTLLQTNPSQDTSRT